MTHAAEPRERAVREPLRAVVRRLLDTRLAGREIDAETMARLTRRLVTSECAVGGPYADGDGSPDYGTNRLIAELFQTYGTVLPALDRWLAARRPPADGRPAVAVSFVTPSRHRSVLSPVSRSVRSHIRLLPPPVRRPAGRIWRKIAAADSNREISGITEAFYRSLRRPGTVALDDGILTTLATANFYAWMAYTVYDDFIDEDGVPGSLPAANLMHRRSVALYGRTPAVGLVRDCFDAMDAANAWELEHCRFPVAGGTITVGRLPGYGDRTVLARRAGAHTLGPLIVGRQAGLAADDRAAVAKAMTHYLIARQLEDDLHDWTDDLSRGHVSPVVAHLLRAGRIPRGTHEITGLTRRLKRLFWQRELAAVTETALGHIAAVRILEDRGILVPDSPFLCGVIAPIEASLRGSRRVHTNQHRFLKAYASSPAAGV